MFRSLYGNFLVTIASAALLTSAIIAQELMLPMPVGVEEHQVQFPTPPIPPRPSFAPNMPNFPQPNEPLRPFTPSGQFAPLQPLAPLTPPIPPRPPQAPLPPSAPKFHSVPPTPLVPPGQFERLQPLAPLEKLTPPLPPIPPLPNPPRPLPEVPVSPPGQFEPLKKIKPFDPFEQLTPPKIFPDLPKPEDPPVFVNPKPKDPPVFVNPRPKDPPVFVNPKPKDPPVFVNPKPKDPPVFVNPKPKDPPIPIKLGPDLLIGPAPKVTGETPEPKKTPDPLPMIDPPPLPPKTTDKPPSINPMIPDEQLILVPPSLEPFGPHWPDAPRHYFPRLGNYWMPPKGPGYYSFKDRIGDEPRLKAPPSAYPPFAFMTPGFFDADFRYVETPGYQPDFFEKLHRIHLGENWLFATGGQAWAWYMNETDSRLTGQKNVYELARTRVYADLWYKDRFRIYAEFISAFTFNQDLPPLKTDQNYADLLNLFIDVKICELAGSPVYVRAGRQELNLGSQRLVSSLDWANTRRTFEGVRGFWLSEKLDIDVFWAQPVLVGNMRFDRADSNQNFAGAWVTYRHAKGQALDLYYLYLDNQNDTDTGGIDSAPVTVHTIGSRAVGDKHGFLWDFESAFQFGARGGQKLNAFMTTAGLGYNWSNGPMNPTFWAYYDWASGDANPNTGDYNTFNPLFPFERYYLGFTDIVGRQNIRDLNFHMYLNPAKWITLNAQYHCFRLDRAQDALYSGAGVPERRSPTGSAGTDVGQEVDVLVYFHMSRRSDILLGWSKLFAGSFIANTGNGQSPELFYAMYNFRW